MTMPIEITIDEPLEKAVSDSEFFDAVVVKRFSTFRAVGSNIYGIRRRAVDGAGITDKRKGNISVLHELGPHGIQEHHFSTGNFHVIAAGTPHRVPHNFGFWHINDMEELSVKFPGPPGEPGFSLIVMRRPVGREGESYAWYCSECLTLMYEVRMRTGEFGLREFWRMEREALRTYNADERLRTCRECGEINPCGYAWDPAKDTPAEALARTQW